ncbi:hypothetical protein MUP29_14220, partial [bacterium]|nr:hypothetical protein [bacterium]
QLLVSTNYNQNQLITPEWTVLIGPQECVRCKARILRKPEAYMPTYAEAFRRVIIPPSAGQMMCY